MTSSSPASPVAESNPTFPVKAVKLFGGILAFILLILAIFSSGNTASANLEEHLSAYRIACKAGDVEKITSFLPPQLIEQTGGITKMTEIVKASFETAKKQGLDLTKVVYETPENIKIDDQFMVAVVPTTINFKMHDGASATLRNSVIAISTNGGSIFYFLEGGDQGKEFLKENYPKLLEMVSIPIAELSVESGGKVTRLELRNGNWVAKQEPLTKAVANTIDQPRQETIGREGEIRKVGTITYKVIRSWWQDKLSSNELLEERPDANFLLVQLIVRNDDKEARTIPPFKLVDETGGEHETTDKAYAFDGSIGELESLNPGVQKEGIVIFDCLKTHRYSLKVSGGFWSAEDGLIALTPQNAQHITESGEVSKQPVSITTQNQSEIQLNNDQIIQFMKQYLTNSQYQKEKTVFPFTTISIDYDSDQENKNSVDANSWEPFILKDSNEFNYTVKLVEPARIEVTLNHTHESGICFVFTLVIKENQLFVVSLCDAST